MRRLLLALAILLLPSLASATAVQIFNGGTGISTVPTYGQLLVGNSSGGYSLIATSSLGFQSGGVSSIFGRTGAVTAQSGDYNTSQVTESGNLYYTDARARGALSSGTGINFNASTGVITNTGVTSNGGDWAGTWQTLSPSHFLTSLAGAASSTLLSDNNTFSGNNTFSNTITGSISGNAGTVTSGVYTTTFPTLFDNRLSATTSVKGITTLPSLSLPWGQISGAPTSYATSTLLADNDTFSGNDTFSNIITGSITGNAGTVTNGVYTTTFGTPFYTFFHATNTDALSEGSTNKYWTQTRFDNALSGTTSVKSITTLPTLSLPWGQISGAPSFLTSVTADSPLSGSGTSGSHLTLDTSGTWSGNAGSATKLATARAINGVNFDGTGPITITAASSTLLGDTNTWSALQTFGYASTTAVSGNSLCIGTDCRTTWPTGGGGSPASPDTSVQFNDGGAFGGDSAFTYSSGSQILTVGGAIESPNIYSSTIKTSDNSPAENISIQPGANLTTDGNGANVIITTGEPNGAGAEGPFVIYTQSSAGAPSNGFIAGGSALLSYPNNYPGVFSAGGLMNPALFDTTQLTGAATVQFPAGISGTTDTFCFQNLGNCAGGGGGSGNVATSSAETAGQVPYWTTTGGTPAKLGSIATSSITYSAPFTTSGTPGYIVGGSGFSLGLDTSGTWTGNAGSATKLATARAINGQNFDGTAAITITAASSTALADSNTWSGTLNTFSNLPKLGTLTGFLAGNSGTTYQVASSSIFGYTPLNPTRNINTTYPITGGGDLSADRTIATAFGTTTAWGIGNNLIIYTSSTGVPQGAASSSLFGYTPLNPTRNINTTWPITGGGDLSADRTIAFNGLSTSTAAVQGNIPYFSGVNTFANVGTTTVSFSGPFTGYSTLGALVGGSNSTVTWTGLSTTSQPSSSNLLVSNGGAGVYGVATTSETYTYPVVCTSHVVLTGGGAITSGFGTTTTWGIGNDQFIYTSHTGIPLGVASSSLNLPNAALAYSSLTVTAGTGLSGGGSIALGSSGTLNLLSYLATSTGETAGYIPYWSSTNGTPAKLNSIATSSESFSGPFTVPSTYGKLVGGSGNITWTGLSTTTQPSSSNLLVSNGAAGVYGVATTSIGCTGFITCTGFSAFGSASTIGITGSLGIANGGTGTTTAPAGQVLYAGGARVYQSVATSSFAVSSGFSYSQTLGAFVGGTGGTLSQIEQRSFSYSTSTTWTGTTTIPLQVAYGQTFNSVRCFTDTGTLGVDFYHASSHLNYIPTASTTIGTVTFSTNNTMTSGDYVKVGIGTPASSPTTITCTVKDTY